MPALGFLKKIRTKDAPGPDSAATNDAVEQSTTPAGDNTLAKTGTGGQEPQGQQPQEIPASAVAADQTSTSTDGPQMTPETNYQQYAPSPQTHPQGEQNQHQHLPHIHNLIHPSQNDNTGQTTANRATPVEVAAHQQVRSTKGKYSLTDFDLRRTLGTGSFGRVHLVQSKHNQRYYAVKVLKKAQVVKMKQVEHTNDERLMLQEVKHPFLITLWGTFQDSKNIYMVMDFVEGGELFSLLRKSQARKLISCIIPC